MLGLLLLIGLAGVGVLLRLPGRIITGLLLLMWIGFVLIKAINPYSIIGGSMLGWLVFGGVVALAFAYRAGLRALSRHALPVGMASPPAQFEEVPEQMPRQMSDDELDRYARHIVLREIGGPGQMRLRGANVLLIGAGGLGAPVALYLAAAGVGRITLADDDTVSLSNLQRQVIFRSDQTGQPKAQAAAVAMGALNPHVAVTPLPRRITAEDVELVARHDLVIDGTDSFASRAIINAVCVAARVPLIAGAITQWEGQVTLYDPARGGPCMACLFPEAPAAGLAPACAEAGVVGALPGVIGSMMALEAIKQLTGAGQGLRGRMALFDGLYGENRMIQTEARKGCAVCSSVQPG